MKQQQRQKTGGRQSGTPNKATRNLREWIQAFVESNTNQIEEDWKTLEPKDRIILFDKLLRYTLPQLQSITVAERQEIDPAMTDEQFEKMRNDARGAAGLPPIEKEQPLIIKGIKFSQQQNTEEEA